LNNLYPHLETQPTATSFETASRVLQERATSFSFFRLPSTSSSSSTAAAISPFFLAAAKLPVAVVDVVLLAYFFLYHYQSAIDILTLVGIGIGI
jgi:hypothetical protein